MAKRERSNQAEAAARIRKDLKAAFPSTTFRVTSKGYSMGDNVRVEWVDGPTEKQVEQIVSKYEAGSFDGMIDLYTYHADRDPKCSTKYLHVNRDYSRETLTAFIERHNRIWGTSIRLSEQHNGINWSSGTHDDITHMKRNLHKQSFVCHSCNATTHAGDAFCGACGAALTECQECHGNGHAWDNDEHTLAARLDTMTPAAVAERIRCYRDRLTFCLSAFEEVPVMERTMTYKGRTFTIRANETEDGYTESITEVGQHVSQPGYTFDETHEWDGSGIVHPTPDACFAAAEQSIRDTVDEEDSMYQIETRDSRGTWTTDGLGEIDANQFATEQDANAMIAQLRTIGPDWADAEYRVVVIAD